MIKPLFALSTICALAACGGSAASPASQGVILNPATAKDDLSKTPIKHVVFIMQENRSFNNLFMGYPGATTASYGYDTRGHKVELHAENLSTGWDLNHSAAAFFADCDGDGKLPGTHCKMDGWNKKRESNDPPNAAYAYVPRKRDRTVLDDGAAIRARRSHVYVEPRRELRRASVRGRGIREQLGRRAVRRLGLRGRKERYDPNLDRNSAPRASQSSSASTIRRSPTRPTRPV